MLFVRSGLEGGGGGGGSGCCSESVGVLLEGLLEDTRDNEEPVKCVNVIIVSFLCRL